MRHLSFRPRGLCFIDYGIMIHRNLHTINREVGGIGGVFRQEMTLLIEKSDIIIFFRGFLNQVFSLVKLNTASMNLSFDIIYCRLHIAFYLSRIST